MLPIEPLFPKHQMKGQLSISEMKVSPLLNKANRIVGWEATLYDQEQKAMASGTASELETAKRITIAEYLERQFFYQMCQDELICRDFLLTEYPSTCGFAAGFDDEKTKMRSLAEALERWAWSMWIDHRCYISPKIKDIQMTELAEELHSRFDEVLFFKTQFSVFNLKFDFGVSLAIKNKAVFAGSRTGFAGEDLWEHSLIEAHRNYCNFIYGHQNNNIICKRITYFANHPEEALKAIPQENSKKFPDPELLLFKEFETNLPGLFLYRGIIKNTIPWTQGPVNRFVY